MKAQYKSFTSPTFIPKHLLWWYTRNRGNVIEIAVY